MNKRAFLLAEETLKIIIAVIAIGFLIYFLSQLYFSKVQGDKLKYAESALERTEEIVHNLEGGEVEEQILANPQGWYLFGFMGEVKPNSCLDENCLCLCPKALDYEGRFNRQQKKCTEKGSCLIVENLGGEVEIKIEKDELNFILIKKENEKILVSKK